MVYRQLGQTDLHISAISFGCMSLRGNEAASIRLLQQAHESGINFFDTADLYDKGANEVLVGKAFKAVRSQVVLATKVGNQWRPDGSGWDWNPSKAYIIQAAEASLRRLDTEYIDLYQLHGGSLEDPLEEILEAFTLLKQQGKIRHFGISSIRPNVIRRWVAHSDMASVMLQYSLLDRRAEETVLPLLAQNKTGVLARGALAQGLLLGKSPKPYLDHNVKAVAKAAQAVLNHANNTLTPTSMALNWALHHETITSTVVGIGSLEHLQAALQAASQGSIAPEIYRQLSKAAPALQYQQHR